MRWSKAEKIIREHPYLICDGFRLPISEAEAIQANEGYPSFEAMADAARKKSSLPDAAWQGVYAAIDKHQAQTSTSPKKRDPAAFTRPALRWALAALCVILLSGYFTLVPSGRALAASFAGIIMQIFDDGFRFSPVVTPDPSQSTGGTDQIITGITRFDAAEKRTGRAFIQLAGNDFTLETITLYENEAAGNMLAASYQTTDGLHVTLLQDWNIGGSPWLEVDTGDTWEETLGDNAAILHCYIDTADHNKFTAAGVWRDSIITIYAEDGIPYKDVLTAVCVPQ